MLVHVLPPPACLNTMCVARQGALCRLGLESGWCGGLVDPHALACSRHPLCTEVAEPSLGHDKAQSYFGPVAKTETCHDSGVDSPWSPPQWVHGVLRWRFVGDGRGSPGSIQQQLHWQCDGCASQCMPIAAWVRRWRWLCVVMPWTVRQ